MITSEVFKNPNSSTGDSVNQDGLRISNCFRCQKPIKERDLVKISKPTNGEWNSSGDVLLTCRSCFKKE